MEQSRRGTTISVVAMHRDLTEQVIGRAFKVYNRMGHGFTESVHEKCLVIELRKLGLKVVPQKPIRVFYEAAVVGEFVADLFLNDVLLVELKAIRTLAPAHEAQLVNYLVATGTEIGFLNSGESGVEVKRKLRILPQAPSVGPSNHPAAPSEPIRPINPV